MAKLDLPSNGSLSDISAYYTELYNTFGKTTTGNLRFPIVGTSRAGYVYELAGTVYANQGQTGMLNLILFGDSLNPAWTNPKMIDYIATAEEMNKVNNTKMTTAATAPASPSVNDIWIDTN